jgi:hypothetical protein
MPLPVFEYDGCVFSATPTTIYTDSACTVVYTGSIVTFKNASTDVLYVFSEDLGLAETSQTFYFTANTDDWFGVKFSTFALQVDFVDSDPC